jgi:hypothetical protein
MSRTRAFVLAALAFLVVPLASARADFYFGIGRPGPYYHHHHHYRPYPGYRVYIAPVPPVYIAPRPVYVAPAPVYVQPAPTYLQTVPVTPAPVVPAVPVPAPGF